MNINIFDYDGYGQVIRRVRRSKGLKMHELAELANVSKSTISNTENGRNFPQPDVLSAIGTALGIKFFFAISTTDDDFARMIEADRHYMDARR